MNITIITVVYNARLALEQTIQSLIPHSNNVQYIVIDGGSIDGTLDVIAKYQHHLKAWVSEPDKGIYDAMNKGWAMADPDSAILFLGAGDLLLKLPNCPDVSAITYGEVFLGSKQVVFKSCVGPKLKFSNTLHHQALLVPKSVHPLPPFDLSYRTYADFDFNQRLYKSGFKFTYSDDLQSYAAPDGISAALDKKQMVNVVYKNFGPFYALISWVYGTYYQLRKWSGG